jgi:hypothetical protein
MLRPNARIQIMIRSLLRIVAVIVGTLATVAVGFIVFMYFFTRPSHDEVSRVTSPDGRVVATLMEVNGGATSSMGYEVYLTRSDMPTSGARVARLYDAVRNESAYGVNLKWESASELSLQYLSAKTALVIVPVWRSGDSAVRVVLRAGIQDQRAPPGGMLHNLEKRRGS